jgi:hypothetical protein
VKGAIKSGVGRKVHDDDRSIPFPQSLTTFQVIDSTMKEVK